MVKNRLKTVNNEQIFIFILTQIIKYSYIENLQLSLQDWWLLLTSAPVPALIPEAAKASILQKGHGVSERMKLCCILTFWTEIVDT